MLQFYAYLWLREDGTPYYAGKGVGDRAFVVRGHKVNPPQDRTRIILFYVPCEAEAFELEMTLIAWYGRKDLGTGCLRNFTNGGEGATGHRISEMARRRMGRAQRGNQNSVRYKTSEQGKAEARAAVVAHGLTFRGHTHSTETRARMSLSARNRQRRIYAA